jgi:subtilisin family serine protease
MNSVKLDGELLALLSEYQDREAESASEPFVEPPCINVFITVRSALAPVLALGFQPDSVFGTLASGKVSLKAIESISELDEVLSISKPKKHSYGLDTSTVEIHADQIRKIQSGDTWKGIATGKDVVVAIIDSGINYEHKSFRKSDGTTRIVGIWDQGLDPGTTPHPDGGKQPNITINQGAWNVTINQGVEYTKDNIRDALAGGTRLRHTDTDGHGTHIAGIAAGNGFQRDHCGRFYPGVAPEADILVIKLAEGAPENGILQAVPYAVHHANAAQKAVVMNLSVSRDTTGGHDGSSELETGLDLILANPLGPFNASLVTIAGNNAHQKTHATGTVGPNASTTVRFQISLNPLPKVIDIWYPKANNNTLACRVNPPAGSATGEVLPAPPPHPPETFPMLGGGRIEIQSRPQPTNPFQNISIGIIPGAGGLPDELKGDNRWEFVLRNTGGNPIEFHAWVFYHDPSRPSIKFTSNETNASTIGIPGTALQVVTVGSFKEPGSTLGFSTGGNISEFSGRGPTIDNRQKPDITAPGEGITAPDHDLPGCCRRTWCCCCNVFHTDKDGTSASAPHVTGAIALMLELNKKLTVKDVRDFIMNNARRDGFTGPHPSNTWGNGKLDVAASVNAVNATLPNPRPFPATPFAGTINQPPFLAFSLPEWTETQNRFLNSPGGRYYVSLAEKHFPELDRLINENKKVATVWHRNDGPLLLRMVMRTLIKPDEPIPVRLNQKRIGDRLVRIAEIIKRFASTDLEQDIGLHLPVLLQCEGISMNQVIAYLGSKSNW